MVKIMVLSFQVKMRILMGTYALSAGYYDAYYKRAQQVIAEQWHPIQHLYLIILWHSSMPPKVVKYMHCSM
jgi:Asp-tRNA(Asn)/Glu-tRNA(Gln) amidotransferase A subunit family amidase